MPRSREAGAGGQAGAAGGRLSRCRPPEGAAAPLRPPSRRRWRPVLPGPGGEGGRREGRRAGWRHRHRPEAARPRSCGRGGQPGAPCPFSSFPPPCASAALAKMSRERGCNRWLLLAACAHLFFLVPPLRTWGECPGRAGPPWRGEGGTTGTFGRSAEVTRGGGHGTAGELGGAPEPLPLRHPLSRPGRGSGGRQDVPLPPKFVAVLGWRADGAARAEPVRARV